MKNTDYIQQHILQRNFPLIITGQSGFNTYSTVIKILERLNLKYVEIITENIQIVHKPIIKCICIVRNHHDKEILSKFSYFDNLIIISDVYIKTYTVETFQIFVKSPLPGKTKKLMDTTNTLLEETNKLTLMRFLGKVFNNKLKGKNISIEKECDYSFYRLNYLFTDLIEQDQPQPEEYEKPPQFYNSRRLLSDEESSEMAEDSEAIPFKQSFSLRTITDLLYTNFTNYTTIDNIETFYDILSLSDIENEQIVTFCIYASQNSTKPKHFTRFSYSNNKNLF